MFGWFASTASAGSFCLFCANGVGGLPTVTCVSGLTAEAGGALTAPKAMRGGGRRVKRKTERFVMRPPPVLGLLGMFGAREKPQKPDRCHTPPPPPPPPPP